MTLQGQGRQTGHEGDLQQGDNQARLSAERSQQQGSRVGVFAYQRGHGANAGEDHDGRHERGPHDADAEPSFDPDYQEWRSDHLRILDNDYRAWRQERHAKHFDAFSQWRKSRSQAARDKPPGWVDGESAVGEEDPGDALDASARQTPG